MKKPDTPFPRHWLGYVVIKFAVLALGILVAYQVAGWAGWI